LAIKSVFTDQPILLKQYPLFEMTLPMRIFYSSPIYRRR